MWKGIDWSAIQNSYNSTHRCSLGTANSYVGVPLTGVSRSFITTYIENTPLVLGGQSHYGAVWKNAICFYGVNSMSKKSFLSITITTQGRKSNDHHRVNSHGAMVVESSTKIIHDEPAEYTTISREEAAFKIRVILYDKCHTQQAVNCVAKQPEEYDVSYGPVRSYDELQRCPCGQMSNPCIPSDLLLRGVFGMIKIPVDTLESLHSSVPSLYCETFGGGKSRHYSWSEFKEEVACGGEDIIHHFLPSPRVSVTSMWELSKLDQVSDVDELKRTAYGEFNYEAVGVSCRSSDTESQVC